MLNKTHHSKYLLLLLIITKPPALASNGRYLVPAKKLPLKRIAQLVVLVVASPSLFQKLTRNFPRAYTLPAFLRVKA